MTDKKRSETAKKIWSKFTPEQRSIRMSIVAKAKHSKSSSEERSAEASRIAKIRWQGSPRMKAVKVSKKTRELFKNPPMDARNNLPVGYEHIDD
jgi:hypothetical protein